METPPTQSPETDKISQALSQAQAKIEDARRTASNSFLGNTYADLTSVMASVRGPLTDHGLAVTQTFLPMTDGEGKTQTYLMTTLLHGSGQFLRGFMPLLGVKDHHSLGSATTYARRFSLAALMSVCPQGEDDDAEAAMGRTKSTKSKPRKKAPPKGKAPVDAKAKCLEVISKVEGADKYLRGQGIDPGDPPPNVRDKILALGVDGFAQRLEEKRKEEAAAAIVDAADKVAPIIDKEGKA